MAAVKEEPPVEFICILPARAIFEEVEIKAEKIDVEEESPKKNPKYYCFVCKQTFKFKSNLYQHLKAHKERLKCPTCGKLFGAHLLVNHLKHHDGKKNVCHICKRRFIKGSGLKAHLKAHVTVCRCDICGRKANNKFNLLTHLRLHKLANHRYRPSHYQCDHCPFKTSLRSPFMIHVRIHKKFRMSKCRLCSFTAPTNTELSKHHNKVHHGRYCKTCDRSFRTDKTFQVHKKYHEKYPDMKCPICSAQFKAYNNISRHMALHKKAANVTSTTCPICSVQFSTISNVVNHINHVHESKNSPPSFILIFLNIFIFNRN